VPSTIPVQLAKLGTEPSLVWVAGARSQSDRRFYKTLDQIFKSSDRDLHVSPIVIGVANAAQGIAEMRARYRELVVMVEMQRRCVELPAVLSSDEAFLYRHLQDNAEFSRAIFATSVEPLLRHDKVEETELTVTLAEFINSGRAVRKTARRLHIRPDSLYGRLKRIEKVTGKDPTDLDNFVWFALGLRAAVVLNPGR
jgi:sugar diacid utilization regulator